MRTRSSLSVACILLITALAQGRTVWYVDDDGDTENGCTSWEDSCPELQKGLSLATDGDQVWVAVGTYKPDYDITTGQHTGDREAAFKLFTGAEIYGGFDGTEDNLEDRSGLFDQTILTGDLLGDDGSNFQNNEENSYHVVTGSGVDETTVLDGFTITAGNATGFGGGMYNAAGSPTVTNCTFSGNSAAGGAGMMNAQSSPMVINCTFSGNRATFGRGGGMYNIFSDLTVTNCALIGNSARSGGGMYNAGSSPTVTNCTFSGNTANLGRGGGMYNNCSDLTVTNCALSGNSARSGGGMGNDDSDPTVINCTFDGNSATNQGGGMFNASSSPTVTNCTFNGNTAVFGGGMINRLASSPIVTNCTFVGNSSNNLGGGIYYTGAVAVVTNSILWSNNDSSGSGESAQIHVVTEPGAMTVTYNLIQGLDALAGPGNIDADPLFIDPGFWDDNGTSRMPDDDFWVNGDYHLSAGSPGIDAADNTAVPGGVVTDLDGNPRFVDDPDTDDTGFGKPPIVDMGAYEFQFQDPCADDDGDGRVTICHWPPGNLSNAHTIIINIRALPAHLAHDDHCGPCEDGRG